jgi:hypothetical protein
VVQNAIRTFFCCFAVGKPCAFDANSGGTPIASDGVCATAPGAMPVNAAKPATLVISSILRRVSIRFDFLVSLIEWESVSPDIFLVGLFAMF